jgi:hypothetical protein
MRTGTSSAGNAAGTASRVVTRVGTATVLGCFGVWELMDPGQWTGYVPHILASIVSPVPLVLLHGWILFVLAAAALVNLLPTVVSWLAVAIMTEVIAGLGLTTGGTSILVRDLGVLALTLAWALDSRPTAARNDRLDALTKMPAPSP